jgi:4-hydroxy-tetrahydrodipicolinate reductase
MGRALTDAAARAGAVVAVGVDKGDPLGAAFTGVDVAIDFSLPEATETIIDLAAASGTPLVIGTTGHSLELRGRLRNKAAQIPCVWTGNYSVGVNVLFHLVKQAAKTLPIEYQAEIVEAHHGLKKDAPSGTAVQLLDAVLSARDWGQEAVVYGREGLTGERPARQVGVHAIRMGDVVGEHTVYFAAAGERLELSHRATSRAIFADGAVRAASWLAAGRPPGVYGMAEVLGLSG